MSLSAITTFPTNLSLTSTYLICTDFQVTNLFLICLSHNISNSLYNSELGQATGDERKAAPEERLLILHFHSPLLVTGNNPSWKLKL